jgi:predicted nucleotidyltransferase
MIDKVLFEALHEVAERTAVLRPGVRWYLFGSAAREAIYSADFDVLAVCPNDDASTAAREEICALAGDYPLHLMIITQPEEDELHFVSEQHCVELFAK